MNRSLILLLLLTLISSCRHDSREKSTDIKKSIGIILVNHGSRSATWRSALWDLEFKVKEDLLRLPDVTLVKTAFMEYTEPSLASQLKACDSAGVSDVIIVPVFLTVSTHSFEDIPTIAGLKEDRQSLENLKIENIEIYKVKARCHITPLLDFTAVMKENVLRRSKALSVDAASEGLTLIGYGDATYNKEWSALFENIAQYVNKMTGIDTYSYGWCGHLVHYNPDSTTAAIERVLSLKQKSIVIPVLLAHDEQFQIKIIGDGIHKIKNHTDKVVYKPDAILPDPYVENWIKSISQEYVSKINTVAIQ